MEKRIKTDFMRPDVNVEINIVPFNSVSLKIRGRNPDSKPKEEKKRKHSKILKDTTWIKHFFIPWRTLDGRMKFVRIKE